MKYYNLQNWLQNYIKSKKFSNWTPIQEKILYSLDSKKNLIGISPTGSGKTLAFLLPILNKIDFSLDAIQAIIICPTRELARQIEAVIREIKEFKPELKSLMLIGGLDLNKLINQCKTTNAQIIICTPTRLLEVVKNLNSNIFAHVNNLALDEADMLLDANFYKDINLIMESIKLKDNAFKIATSATLHNLLNDQLKNIFKNVKVIDLNNYDAIIQKTKHHIIKSTDKMHSLSILLGTISPYFCIIFTNTISNADKIYKYLLSQGYNAINLHSGLSTRQRKNNYNNIKKMSYQYVVASDLVSRGLDIDGSSHVISFDLPNNPEWYIHRAGRVGRSKYTGDSYIIYKDSDQNELQKLNKYKIQFNVLQIKNNELINAKMPRMHKKKISTTEQDKEIKHLINSSQKKVKPGYKKKLKEEIKKINQKYKHRHIDKLIKEQRKKKYMTSNNK